MAVVRTPDAKLNKGGRCGVLPQILSQEFVVTDRPCPLFFVRHGGFCDVRADHWRPGESGADL